MNNEERFEIAREAKFCLRCLNPRVTFSDNHLRVCPTNLQKNSYSCTKCNLHSWVCTKHKSENSGLLQGFANEMTRHNIGFTYLINPLSSQGRRANPWIPTTAKSLREEEERSRKQGLLGKNKQVLSTSTPGVGQDATYSSMEVTPETLDTSNQEATDQESNTKIEMNDEVTRIFKEDVHDDVENAEFGDQMITEVNMDQTLAKEINLAFVDENSRALLENAKEPMKADEDGKEIKTLFEGSFLENSEAILKTLNMLTEAEIKEDDHASQRNLSFPERLSENSSAESFDEILDDPSPKNILDDEDMNSTTSDITNDYVETFLQDKIATQEFEMSEHDSELNDAKKPARTEILDFSGSPRQKNVEDETCCLYNSVPRVIALTLLLSMHCALSMVYEVLSVILLALLITLFHDRPVVGCRVLPMQGEVHMASWKTDLLDWPVVENADYKVDEFDNKPEHKLEEDLSDKSEECGAKLMYLVDAMHTDQVPGMLDTEERRTYFNHRLACSRTNNLRYLKMIPLVNDDPADPRKLMLVTVPELLGNLVLVPAPELRDELVRVPPLPGELLLRESLLKTWQYWSATPAPFRTCLGCPQREGRSCAARPAPAPRSTLTSLPENL